MPEDQDNNGKGGLTDASNEENILHPTTIDRLLEALRKDSEAKNTTIVEAVVPSYSFKQRSNKVAEQFKPINIQTYTFEGPLTSTSKVVSPSVNELSNMVTLDQIHKIFEEQDAKLVTRVSTLFHNANLKKLVGVASVVPSCHVKHFSG